MEHCTIALVGGFPQIGAHTMQRAVRIMMGLTEASRDECLQAIVESVVFGLKNSQQVVDGRLEDAVALQTGVQHARQSPREFWRRATLLVATACRKHGELDRVLPRVRRRGEGRAGARVGVVDCQCSGKAYTFW